MLVRTWINSGYSEADLGSCSRQIKQLQASLSINGDILTIKLSGVATPMSQASSVYELNEEQKMRLNFAFKLRIPRIHVAQVLLLDERQTLRLNYKWKLYSKRDVSKQ